MRCIAQSGGAHSHIAVASINGFVCKCSMHAYLIALTHAFMRTTTAAAAAAALGVFGVCLCVMYLLLFGLLPGTMRMTQVRTLCLCDPKNGVHIFTHIPLLLQAFRRHNDTIKWV